MRVPFASQPRVDKSMGPYVSAAIAEKIETIERKQPSSSDNQLALKKISNVNSSSSKDFSVVLGSKE